MIEKDFVKELVEKGLSGTDCFIVDVQVKPGNSIIIEIDNEDGIDIEQCSTLHRFIEEHLDRDIEDYELEVGSAGITSPFKVLKQYKKNIGNEVEVLTKSGLKLNGILQNDNDQRVGRIVPQRISENVRYGRKLRCYCKSRQRGL